MKSRLELFFALITIPIDFILIVLAAISAYYLRIGSFVTEFIPVVYTLPINEFINYALGIAISWIIIFALVGLYRIKPQKKFIDELYKVIQGATFGVTAVIVAIFLQRELFSSRFIIVAFWVISIVYLTLGRTFIIFLQRQFYKRGFGIRKTIIIGNDKNTYNLIQSFKDNPKFGIRTIKHYQEFNQQTKQEILDLMQKEKISLLIQGDPATPRQTSLEMTNFSDINHLGFMYGADLLGTKSTNIDLNTISGILLFEVKKTPLDGWGRIYKRTFDVLGSLILITLTSPIMLITAIAIKLTSKGPVFFSRRDDDSKVQRVGQNGRLFYYFKFRSMYNKVDSLRYSKELQEKDLRKDSPLVKIEDDPRITKVGKFIRRYSIDELPEFFLVLKGDMSLVGPRPHLPEEVEKYKDNQKKVLTIKPGVTGLAQISGRSDLDFDEEVRLDAYYIENWSLKLDLYILFKTPFVLFKKRQAL